MRERPGAGHYIRRRLRRVHGGSRGGDRSHPRNLSDVDTAPLLCAGITTFNALRESVARPGDLVAILGVGGLGHLGIQYAAKMGFEVVAIARGEEKGPLAKGLGAHHYIDSTASGVGEELTKLGGAKVVLATVTVPDAMTPALGGLKPRGQRVVVGASTEPIQVPPFALIPGSTAVQATRPERRKTRRTRFASRR